MSKVLLFGEAMGLFTSQMVGELEEVNVFEKSVAGAEINVGTGLSRLGHSVSYITRLGDDPIGIYIKNFISKENIGTEFITFDNLNKTGLMLKNKVSKGDPTTAYYRKGSAFSYITSEDIDNINFEGVELLHITGIPPALSLSCRQATYRLIERAKEKGIYITFDPNLRPSLWESEEVMVDVLNDIAKKCDLILPGIGEGLILTGSDDKEKIADFYQSLGVKEVIIKNGSKGAYVRSFDDSFDVAGFKVEKVIDTVGAGDGFAVGVLSGKLEGISIKECAIRGNAIGAIQVTYLSDNEGLPTQDELKKFIENRI
ncbi:sugar kinase [Clostridium paraputrificum]|uniref:sugar kinase n=1 Tax=Clostridium paraputrificum TaxID=29363 RepID=UPI0034A2DBDA